MSARTTVAPPNRSNSHARAARHPRLPGTRHDSSVEELFQQTHAGGLDAERARAELVARFLPLARRLALRYSTRSEALDDLVQVACLGLVKAIERYDPARGAAFSTFAVPTILGELRRHFRDHAWALHVPRSMQERSLVVQSAVEELTEQLGHSPSVAELAERLGWAQEDVVEGLSTRRALGAESLDARRGQDGATHLESLGRVDAGFELAEYGAAIAPALAGMEEQTRLALHLRFVEDLTQSEIAGRLGVSQMQVSRILRRALEALRVAADDGGQADSGLVPGDTFTRAG